MINVILCGCGGRMGRAVTEAINNNDKLSIVAGVDVNASSLGTICDFPVYQSISDFPDKADVIIDFSHHSALPALCAYATATSTPLVICTTGHSEDEMALMTETSYEKVFIDGCSNTVPNSTFSAIILSCAERAVV